MKLPVNKIVKGIWLSFIGGLLCLCLLIFFVRINLFGLFGELPGFEILENPKNDEASFLYASDGVILGSYYREKRTPVEYSQLPFQLKNALIATEDARFKAHSGIDFKGTFAILFYLLQGKKRGSSTLTQQTAKNLFNLRISDKYRGSLSENMLITKIKEWMVAIQLERAYTKNEILTMYLNTVEFGRRTFGIKSAAETFFNKQPEELTQNEAALLVGLLKGPSFYDPIRHPDRALARRNTVLEQMLKYGKLSVEEERSLEKEPLNLKYHAEGEEVGIAPYLRNYLKDFLNTWAKENDYDLYGDGLKIFTTVDARMQAYAEKAVAHHMKDLQKLFDKQWKNRNPWTDKDFIIKLARKSSRYQALKRKGLAEKEILEKLSKPVKTSIFTWEGDKEVNISPLDSIKHTVQLLHTGFLSLNPQSGQIKAYIGNIDFSNFKYDNVYQSRRQPGSAFKSFVYAYAMEEKGLTPCSKVLDVEVAYPWGSGVWTPRNSHGEYSNTPVTLKVGLAKSINSVAANLMMQSGPENIVKFAHRIGIESDLEAVPSLALGTEGVSLFEMVGAYATFVNGGTYIKPHALLRIEDKYGNVIADFKPESKEVMSEKTAFYMVELLKAGTEIGTSRGLRTRFGITAEVGGKTGTTQNSADGWYIGISPELVTGVWVGGQSRDIRLRGGQGATMALPIWAYYMKAVFTDKSIGLKKAGYYWKEPMPDVNCYDSTATPNDNQEGLMEFLNE